MKFLLKLAALGSILLALLNAYPGVLVDLLFAGILLSPLWLPALGIAGLAALFLRARSARKKPLEPNLDLGGEDIVVGKSSFPDGRPLLISSAILIVSLFLIETGIPRRTAFLLSRPAFQRHIANAPASESEGEALGRRLGVYYVDRYAADPRGGVYFRTHAGSDGIGPDTRSYGFAFRPNSKGTPFGRAGYRYSHVVGDWHVFSASNDW